MKIKDKKCNQFRSSQDLNIESDLKINDKKHKETKLFKKIWKQLIKLRKVKKEKETKREKESNPLKKH